MLLRWLLDSYVCFIRLVKVVFLFSTSFLVLSPHNTYAQTSYTNETTLCKPIQSLGNITIVSHCLVGSIKGRPNDSQAYFYWIQCGYFSGGIIQRITNDPNYLTLTNYGPIQLNLERERKNHYRCLLGPYSDLNTTLMYLKQIRKETSLDDAFIRRVHIGAQEIGVFNKNTGQVISTELTARSKDSPRFVLYFRKTWQGRAFAVFSEANVQKPYLTEKGIDLSRLTFSQAKQACESLGWSLISEELWSELNEAGDLAKWGWPMRLPYWGNASKGLFVGLPAQNVSETSALFVACFK